MPQPSPRSVTLSLKDRLGLDPSAKATDALNNRPVPIKGGTAECALPNLGWKLIRIA